MQTGVSLVVEKTTRTMERVETLFVRREGDVQLFPKLDLVITFDCFGG